MHCLTESPDKVHVSPVGNGTMIEGKPHSLKCDVFNYAPAKELQVNWYQDGKLINTDQGKEKTFSFLVILLYKEW